MNEITKKPHPTLYAVATIMLVFIACFFSSCNNLESKAKKQLDKTLEEVAYDPMGAYKTNESVIYSDDSLCVINFTYHAKNKMGGMFAENLEYVYLVLENEDREHLYVNENGNLVEAAKDCIKKAELENNKKYDNPKEFKTIIWALARLGTIGGKKTIMSRPLKKE